MGMSVYNLFSSVLDEKSYKEHASKLITEARRNKSKSPDIDFKGDESDSDKIIGKVSVELIGMVKKRLNKIQTINITETEGDIEDLDWYDSIEKTVKLTRAIEESDGKKKELYYGKIYIGTFEFLKDRKKKFRKAIKESENNLMALLYIGLVMYLMEMTSIMSTALLNWIDEDKSIDETIEDKDEYKKVFIKTKELMESDDLDDFFKVDFRDSLIGESTVPLETIEYYGEASINDTLKLFSLGLAKFVYKITGFLRYIVYLFHYSKYNMEKKKDKIKTVLKMYEEENPDKRQSKKKDADKQKRNYRVQTIEADDRTEKQMQKDKVKIEDGEGFSV